MDRTKLIFVAGLILLFLIVHSELVTPWHTVSVNPKHFLPAQSEDVWTIINDDYVGNDIFPYDIVFVNATHGWILSQTESGLNNGIILHTRDGGNTWSSSLQNTSDRYRKIAVIDTDTICVTCREGLYYTNNSGDTWNLISIAESDDDSSFYGIYFLNRTYGWISSYAHMYKTIDGGKNWQMLESWDFECATTIRFVTAQEGWAAAFTGIYHTTDGGATWEKRYNEWVWTLSLISKTEAWAVGDDWIAKMSDGKTWITQPSPRDSPVPPPIAPYYTDIFFIDSMHGWLAGTETEVAYTPDGGHNWYSQSFPGSNRVMSFYFINATHGWAVEWGGCIYRTTRGNSLGTRLWMGLSDPIIIAAISVPVVLIISLIGLVKIRKKKHNHHKSAAVSVDLI